MSDPLREKLEAELLKRSATAAVDRAAAGVERIANDGLDALERILLGGKSAADLAKAEQASSPLERLRVQMVRVIVAGGDDFDKIQPFRGDDPFGHADVRLVGRRVLARQRIRKVRVEQQEMIAPTDEKTALPKPP